MISLLLATIRLATVIAALIWLPGWIASGRPLRPWRVLHACVLGTFVHMVALVVTGFMVQGVTPAARLLPLVSFAVALVIRRVLRASFPVHQLAPSSQPELAPVSVVPAVTPSDRQAPWEPPALGRGGMALVGAAVVMAALLRWFHNFHYDDLAHFTYLTEILREGRLFPDQFLLELTPANLPLVGRGVVLLSRYPYWGASYTVLGQLARVTPGDGYLLIGLAVLMLTLAQMAAQIGRAWSPSVGALWVAVLLAASPFVNDNLLNYGGYPFQTGKLFVLMGATSIVAAWVTRRPEELVPAAVGLFIGPLLHTNNAVGAAFILPMLIAASVMQRPLRQHAAATMLSVMLLLGVTAGGALFTQGFARWESRPSVGSAPGNLGRQAPVESSAIGRGQVIDRIRLFADRGMPDELLLALLATMLLPLLRPYAPILMTLSPYAFGLAVVMTLGVSAAELARAVVTSVFKPGYFVMRSSLRETLPLLDGPGEVISDPITVVLGRAAGWPLTQPLRQGVLDQTQLLLLYRPDVRGEALDRVADSLGPALVVVNDRIVGDGAADKLSRHAAFERRGQTTGAPGNASDALLDQLAGLQHSLEQRDAPTLLQRAPVFAGTVLTEVFTTRRVAVFAHLQPLAGPLDLAAVGALLRREGRSVPLPGRPYLNSSIVTMAPPAGCATALDVSIENLSSFDSGLAILPLDPLPVLPLPKGGYSLALGTSAFQLRFAHPVCDQQVQTVLLHGTYWWDTRFIVKQMAWDPATQ